jgi:polyketide synthase PksN
MRTTQDIAIIGISGRFPEAKTLDQFWSNLEQGRHSITEVPADRWDVSQFYSADPEAPNKAYCKWGGFLSDIDKFDPWFFGISPREAAVMDPQQRLFLEEAWKALEDAGYAACQLSNRNCGVFLGAGPGDYLDVIEAAGFSESYLLTGNTSSTYSGRLAYILNLKGPCLTIDTACSSSLVAIHLACQSIIRGDAEMALAGGVAVMTTPKAFILTSKTGLVSRTGLCKAFDDGADGYVPGEAVGVVVLKSLSQALSDSDHIYGVIKGSGINHAGRTNGLLAPGGLSQTALQLEVYEKARINPESISYVETHGTGTRLGDAIEINALTAAFRKFTQKRQFCPVGSLKPNIGHCGQPSGVASLIKVLLSLKNQKIPPSLNYAKANQLANFKESPFDVNIELKEWPASTDQPRRAVINSFGHSGTNAFLIVEEAPATASESSPPAKPFYLVNLSAKTEEGLHRRMADLDAWLETHEDPDLLPAVCYTLSVGRSHFRSRASLIIRDLQDLRRKIRNLLRSDRVEDYYYNPNARIDGEAANHSVTALTALLGLVRRKALEERTYKNALIGLANFYARGFDINWEMLFQDGERLRLPLPPYSFARERHWVSRKLFDASVAPPIRTGDGLSADEDEGEFLSFRGRNAKGPEGNKSPKEPVTSYCHPFWLKEEGSIESRDLSETEILVFDHEDEIFLELKNRKQQPFLIKQGETFAQIGDNQYQLRSHDPDDYSKLFEHLEQRGVRAQRILHLWNCHAEALGDRHSLSAETLEGLISADLNSGLYSIFVLAKTLTARKCLDDIALLYVYQSSESFCHPPAGAVSAMARAIQHENPRLTCKTLQLRGNEIPPEKVLDVASREFRTSGDTEVRYVGQQRNVRRFVALNETHGHRGRTEQKVSIREGGVYLISGGAGGLGLIFANFLARKFHAKLVLVGRSDLTPEKQERLRELEQAGAQVLYCRADVTRIDEVHKVLERARDQFGQLHGVIHAAGIVDDAWIINKNLASFAKVLAPKVTGTINLDAATSAEELDFFTLFSSVTSVTGNIGQSDYAAANQFLDGFAELREHWRTLGKRCGKTVSINWPYWLEGGMRAPAESAELAEQLLGLKRLSTRQGLEAFMVGLNAGQSQTVVWVGEREGNLFELVRTKGFSVVPLQPAATSGQRDKRALASIVEKEILEIVAGLLQIETGRLEADADFSEFGMNSAVFTQLVVEINKTFRLQLAPAIIFEHHTLRGLTQFLVQEHGERLWVEDGSKTLVQTSASLMPADSTATSDFTTPQKHGQRVASVSQHEPIAIVGIGGVFPQASDVDAFWKLLEGGNEAITEIPKDRWNWRDYEGDPSTEEGKTLSRWGGFISEVDKFDALFFNISPHEAELMDPQQRIFMETVWKTIEDSGHKPSDLWDSRTGVFVGVQSNDYAELLIQRSDAQVGTGLLHSMLANRVSYFLNLHGPSESIDTACSSAAVAIHRAVQSIRSGESQQAIAGGANVMLSPKPHIILSQMGLLTPDRKCRAFDKDANGYIRGECVAAVLLKPLSRALEDGNPIYATILATAENHGGRTLSLGAPSPEAQAEAIVTACLQAGVDPETIGYIEAQGTATSVGDPVEINAFKAAFANLNKQLGEATGRRHFCGIGSLKPNIGHLEAASGIAALIKVVLALKYQKLPATINIKELNPYIELDRSPFYIVDRNTVWEERLNQGHVSLPRRAGVHSFGFGGTIVHILLQEHIAPLDARPIVSEEPALFVLSAKNEQRLRAYAQRLKIWLQELEPEGVLSLPDIAFTLQVGREPMLQRLAMMARTREELIQHLEDYLANREGSDCLVKGNVKTGGVPSAFSGSDEDDQKYFGEILRKGKLRKIASLWVQGATLDWRLLHEGNKRRRVSLPTYPFAAERHWIPETVATPVTSTEQTTVRRSVFPSQEALQTHLHALMAGLLKLPETDLDVDEKLSQFGVDSIVLIQMLRRFKATYGVDLSVKAVVANPTIRGVTCYVWDQMKAAHTEVRHEDGPAAQDTDGARSCRHAVVEDLRAPASDHGNGASRLEAGPDMTKEDAEQLLARMEHLSDEEVEIWLRKFEIVKG